MNNEAAPTQSIEDLAYDLYKALDGIMWRAPQLPDSETKPAQAAMDAYEKWLDQQERRVRASSYD